MTTAILTAATVLADAGIRTAHTIYELGEQPRALVDDVELRVVAEQRDLDLVIELPEDPWTDGWTWGTLTIRGVELRAGVLVDATP